MPLHPRSRAVRSATRTGLRRPAPTLRRIRAVPEKRTTPGTLRSGGRVRSARRSEPVADQGARRGPQEQHTGDVVHRVDRLALLDRKSTRLNSSHSSISYAVFCLKKKKKTLIIVIFKKDINKYYIKS